MKPLDKIKRSLANRYRRILLILTALFFTTSGLSYIPESTLPLSSPADRQARLEGLTKNALAAYPNVPTITAAKAIIICAKSPVLFLDVRSENERRVSQIPHAITLDQLNFRISQNKHVATSKIIVYCTIGKRSADATQELRQRGLPAVNLRGGILAWIAAGESLVDANHQPTKKVHVYAPRWNVLPPDYEGVW